MSLWKVDEAADFLGIRPKTLYEWVRQGRVPHRKLGFNVRFHPDELRKWTESQARGPGAGGPEATDAGDSGGGEGERDTGSDGDERPGRDPVDDRRLRRLRELARDAAEVLGELQREVGSHLSYPKRERLGELLERLEAAGSAEDVGLDDATRDEGGVEG